MARYRLEEIAPICQGVVPKSNQYWLLNLDAVESNTGKVLEYVYVDHSQIGASTITFDESNVLYSKLRPYLNKVVLPEMPGYATSEMLPLKPDSKIITREYLTYFLRSPSFVEYINGKTSGAKMPRANISDLKAVEIDCPTIKEQKEVASAFAKLECVVIKRQQQLSALDDLIRARFVEMFGDQESNPFHYKVGTLKDVSDIFLGLTHTPTYVDKGRPFISVRDISSGSIDFSNCHYITEEEFQSLPNGAKPKANDLLFCRVGTIGKPVIVPEETPEFGSFVSVGFLRKKSNVFNEYLKAWMENSFFMKQVYDNVAGASQINLNTGWLKNFRILIPPLEKQNQFSTFVKQVDKSKSVIQKSLDKTQLLFDSLMQQYFG